MAGVSMDSSDVLSSVSSNSTDLLIQEDKGTDDSQFFPAPSTTKDSTASVPDATPSRRSSRKKQSTFSSDFEYYTPTGRRVEIDVEPTAATKGKQTGKSQKAPQQKIAGSEDENEEDDSSDDDDDDDEIKKFVQKKVNERKQKGKEADEEDDEVDKEESIKSGKWKVKVAVKRKAGKEASMKKGALKKQTDEEGSSDEKDEEFSADPSKVQKRKKTGAQQVKGKKMKVDESSDEEESTPISQLKAQLRQKKLDENKSPPRQNIMEKLAEGSPGQGSESDRLHSPALKRKMSTGDGSVDEGPTKAVKTIKVEKLGPALANLVKQLPPLMNLGAVKQSPSKMVTNSELPQRVASLAKVEENLDRKVSVKTESDSSHRDKSKIHADIASRKLSSECDKTSKSLKTEVEKTITKVESHHKNEERLKHSGKNVKFDPKIKGEVRHVKKVQIVRKPDGTIIKRKIIVPEGKTVQPDEKHSKIKMSELKNGEKHLSGIQKPKPTVDGQKLKIPTGNSLSKKLHGQPAGTVVQKKEVVHAKIEGTGQKQQAVRSTSSEAIKKPDLPRQTVDDLLKRGIVHKKKSHQPFGNKNVVKIHGKDLKSEAVKVISTKQEQPNNKPKIHKSEGGVEMRKSKDTEKRKLSDVHKHSNGKRRSSESNKGERRKSAEGVSKKSEKPAESGKKAVDDGPPALIPATGMGKVKHKHHKSEHEVPIDMTMMDLFKPDNLVTHDQQKKDEVTQEETTPGPSDKVSQYSEDAYSIYSFVKPENLHHILLEHQYSKPSSPVSPKREGQEHTDSSTRRDDDIESVSHKQAVIMDVNLPDQILEESEEPVMEESVGDYQETWPDTMEELQLLVSRRDAGDRPSILESLDTELKEGGSEFRIVGQVEIERMPIISREENISTTQLANSTRQVETLVKNVSEVIKPSIESRKLSTDTKKPSTEKRRDSGDKKGHSSDRRDSTAAGNNDPEKRKHKKKKKLDAADLTQEDEGSEVEDDEEEHKFEDDEKDLDWEPNDADTLYCICRKPHNNRFMICCDRCEEWYHGTCVGITKAKGKEMEEKEEEYICPLCAKGEKISVTEKQALPLKTAEVPLVLPKAPQKCVGRKCTRAPRPGSVYCSNECIMSHAQESLKAIRDEHMRKKVVEKQQSAKDKSSSSLSTTKASSVDTVEVVEKLSGKLLTGLDAPTQKGLHRWLEQNPTFEVVQPHKHRGRSSSTKDRDGKSDKEKKHSSEKPASSEKERKPDQAEGVKARHDSTSSRDSEKKSDSERQRSSSTHKPDNSSSSSKVEERKEDGPNQIRLSVRTALRDSLTARAQEASDIMLSSNEIKNLAVTIEEELFSLFSDTGHKYRTKYRSLVFNIKDQKNKGLFRKILTGKIKPHKLVQMSTEELASRELAKWREQASKHELEMIEKSEKEAMREREMAKHVRKKTHKGEVEVEDEDLSTLEIRLKEAKDVEPEPQEEQTQVPVIDTTDQHRAHLFDLNCKVCTGKMVPGSEEQATAAVSVKATAAPLEPQKELTEASTSEDREDYEKAEEIVKEAFRTMQKMEESVTSMPKIVSSSPREEEVAPPLSPKLSISRRESSSSSSTSSSTVSSASKKQVVVRSPDSALQSGLEAKPKFTPTGPVLWKGFMSMLDVAKFFTSAYQVSGPTDYITLPDTVHILGRISPDHMWDYLSKIRQAGSKDLTVIRFIPGSDDEKIAYIHLYSYLNSRGRCGVAGNPNKQVKDFYIVPLASHSRIPRTLLPFDGPGLEENRPHMLIGILVRQRGKHGADTSDTSSTGSGKSSSVSSSGSGKSGNLSSTGSGKSSSLSTTGSGKSSSLNSTSSATKHVTPPVNRDPRLAKLSAKEASPRVSPADSSSSSSSNAGEARPKPVEEYEPQYIKNTYKPVAEYIPTPTVKKKHPERAGVLKDGKTSSSDDSSGKSSRNDREKHRHHHQKKVEKKEEIEDSDPYSPGKEAEPYSPGQEAAADEPYDPADDSLIDDTGIPIVSSTTVSVSKPVPLPASAEPATDAGSSTKPAASYVESTAFVQKEKRGTKKKKTDSHTSDLVEKMARSNDPQEISSLMVIALSGVSSSQEQQRLLVELTKKVEERKLQLAEAARQGLPGPSIRAEDSEKPRLDSQILSLVGNSEVAGDTVPTGCTSYVSTSGQSAAGSAPVGAPALSDASLNSAGLKTTTDQGPPLVTPSPSPALYTLNLAAASIQPLSAPGAVSQSDIQSMLSSDLQSVPSVSASANSAPQVKGTVDTVGIKFSINSSATKNRQILSSSAAEIFTSETGEPKPKLPLPTEDTLTQLTFVPTRSDSTDVGRSVGTPDSSGDIPDALKALMDDVMGNTRFSSLEKRRKILLQKEVKRGEGTTKEFAKEEPDTKDKLVLEQQAEVQSKLIDETEAKKILDNLKRLEKSGTGDDECRDSTKVDSASDDSKSDFSDTKKPSSAAAPAAPSIDELLDRLKRGGFQFNLQKAEISTPSSSSSSPSSLAPIASQPIVTPTNDSQSSGVPAHSLYSTTSTPHAASVLPSQSSVSSAAAAALDVDLRQKNDSQFPTSGGAISSGFEGDYPKATSYKDYVPGPLPVLHDQDDRTFYKDQDDRPYRAIPPHPPKHPLDPHAFPPLPGEVRCFPPPPSTTTIPLPHGPLHPRFPLPPTLDPHVPYHPTPRATLPSRSRTQPPPPGTESDRSAGVTGVTDDFPSDMDFRNKIRPPAPPHQPLPPLPTQSPPLLPPPPGFRGPPGDHYRQSSEDIDYRPPPSHRSDYYGRGRDRSFQ